MINQTFYPGQEHVDPFAPENIELSAELIAENQRTPTKTTKPKKQNESLFVLYPYDAQMNLAKQTRNCLIAVQAELYRLYLQKWDKTQPIELGNRIFQSFNLSGSIINRKRKHSNH
jgi:hypothetical protein